MRKLMITEATWKKNSAPNDIMSAEGTMEIMVVIIWRGWSLGEAFPLWYMNTGMNLMF